VDGSEGIIAQIVQYNNDNSEFNHGLNIEKVCLGPTQMGLPINCLVMGWECAMQMCNVLMKGNDALEAYALFNSQFNKLFGALLHCCGFVGVSFGMRCTGINCTQTSYADYIRDLKDIRPYPENANAAGAHPLRRPSKGRSFIHRAADKSDGGQVVRGPTRLVLNMATIRRVPLPTSPSARPSASGGMQFARMRQGGFITFSLDRAGI